MKKRKLYADWLEWEKENEKRMREEEKEMVKVKVVKRPK